MEETLSQKRHYYLLHGHESEPLLCGNALEARDKTDRARPVTPVAQFWRMLVVTFYYMFVRSSDSCRAD
jgi:hypothetical protein